MSMRVKDNHGYMNTKQQKRKEERFRVRSLLICRYFESQIEDCKAARIKRRSCGHRFVKENKINVK